MGEMSGLWEGIIFSLLFVVLLTGVLAHFNNQYGGDHTVGLETDSFIDSFEGATSAAHSETGGEVSQTSEGLTMTGTWNMARGIFSTLWDFVTGNWIEHIIVEIFQLGGTAGQVVAGVLRMAFLAMLIFGIIKLFMKVTT